MFKAGHTIRQPKEWCEQGRLAFALAHVILMAFRTH
jgi:hypothetical protein